jgi:hypothetical protein
VLESLSIDPGPSQHRTHNGHVRSGEIGWGTRWKRGQAGVTDP